MNSIESLHNQINAANVEIERIKRICHELYLVKDPIGMIFHTRVEIAMRDVLGLSKPVPRVEIDEKDIPY